MGGQACILYGAAEFSRDVHLAVAVAPRNLARLRAALDELQAEPAFLREHPDIDLDAPVALHGGGELGESPELRQVPCRVGEDEDDDAFRRGRDRRDGTEEQGGKDTR
jgi:hypothetical protein